jgi:hypothetical protein
VRIEHGDLWTYRRPGCLVVIPTNMQVKQNGLAVMGGGLAKQAADRYPTLPGHYGNCLRAGIPRTLFKLCGLLLLPTKDHWRDPSDLELIRVGCEWLIASTSPNTQVALPQLGCGLGGLDWETQVRPILEEILTDDRFVVVIPNG